MAWCRCPQVMSQAPQHFRSSDICKCPQKCSSLDVRNRQARIHEDCSNSILTVKFSKVWGAEIIWPDLEITDCHIDFRHRSYHFIAPNYTDAYWYGACQCIPTGHWLVCVFPHIQQLLLSKQLLQIMHPQSGRLEERKKKKKKSEGKTVKRCNEYNFF